MNKNGNGAIKHINYRNKNQIVKRDRDRVTNRYSRNQGHQTLEWYKVKFSAELAVLTMTLKEIIT